MRIAHEDWKIDEKYLTLNLDAPYWGAWARFGWEQGVEGISISKEAALQAIERNLKIRVVVKKYGTYEITTPKALEIGKQLFARNGTELLCIPRTKFGRSVMQDTVPTEQPVSAMGALAGMPEKMKEELRRKLHA